MAIVRGIAAVLVGLISGSVVNMGLIVIGPNFIPPPPGVDSTSMESLAAGMHLFGPEHFVVPFLAHALGALVGAMVAVLIAASHKRWYGLGIGGFFLLGGTVNAFMLPAPTWFIVLDLVGAYLPMAFLGVWLAGGLRATQESVGE